LHDSGTQFTFWARWSVPHRPALHGAGAFFFSLMSLLVKLAGSGLPSAGDRAGPLPRHGGGRMGHAAPAPHTAGRYATPSARAARLLGFGALSCFYYALVHLPLADATVLQYTNPAWAAVFAIFILSERMRGREVASVALSLCGVLLVARPSFLFGAASASTPSPSPSPCSARVQRGAYVVVRMLGGEHYLVVIFYFAVVSSIGSAPAALLHGVMPTPPELLILVGVGLTTHMGQVFITKGLYLERTGRATATGLVQIVFAAVWGASSSHDARPPRPWWAPDWSLPGSCCGALRLTRLPACSAAILFAAHRHHPRASHGNHGNQATHQSRGRGDPRPVLPGARSRLRRTGRLHGR
jgi:drug/metabolite transporter (DMT)-like permease